MIFPLIVYVAQSELSSGPGLSNHMRTFDDQSWFLPGDDWPKLTADVVSSLVELAQSRRRPVGGHFSERSLEEENRIRAFLIKLANSRRRPSSVRQNYTLSHLQKREKTEAMGAPLAKPHGCALTKSTIAGHPMPEGLQRTYLGRPDLWVLAQTEAPGGVNIPKVFVEIGAPDGLSLSNSYLLESEHGWTGTCVEPLPEHYESRSCNLISKAVVAREVHHREYLDCRGTVVEGCSGFADSVPNLTVLEPCKPTTVEQIFTRDLFTSLPEVIGYMSIDLGATEYDVVSTFPFETHCAWLWTVEPNGDAAQVNQTREALTEKGCQHDVRALADYFTCNCSFAQTSFPSRG